MSADEQIEHLTTFANGRGWSLSIVAIPPDLDPQPATMARAGRQAASRSPLDQGSYSASWQPSGGNSAQPHQNLPHALGGPGATLTRPWPPGRWECRPSIYSERVPVAARLNTAMITDLTALAAVLLANFRSVRIPAPDDHQRPPDDWWGSAKARRAKNGRGKFTATGFAVNWPTTAIASWTAWKPILPAGGDSTFSSPMKLPSRYWTNSRKGHAAQVIPVTLGPEEFISEQLGRLRCADECP
jgi:hypothetical protein